MIDNIIAGVCVVIDNAGLQDAPVIDNAKSKVPKEFRAWANQVRQVHGVRDWRAGGRSVGGVGVWWSQLPDSLRAWLLAQVAPDEVDSWQKSPWDAMPGPLMDAIAVESRKAVRALEGCPWR